MSTRLSAICQTLLKGYKESQLTQRIQQEPLISVEDCLACLRLCQEVLFPGYFTQKDLTWDNVAERQCGNLRELQLRLQALTGAETAWAFLETLPEIRRRLLTDAQAALDGDPAANSLDEVILAYPGFLAVTVYRIAHQLLQFGQPLLARILSEWAHSQTGADIHPAAQIGESFFIDHATGVVIGATTVIGLRVRLYQGVTLGALSLPRDAATGKVVGAAKRHPTLEDEVTVYANAVILGGDTIIGAGSVIGGAVFLTRSVPPGHRVILEPPALRTLGPKSDNTQGEILTCPIDFAI